jgi:hypothetical protein
MRVVDEQLWIWELDDSLRLKPLDRLPTGVVACPMHERAIDTVLARNLDMVCAAMLGSPGAFLFNNSEYWKGIDLGCVLADGRLVCIENKRKRATPQDYRKFAADVRQVHGDGGLLYVAHRWQHHKENLAKYQDIELRMYAGFFLGMRCETVKDKRDVPAEAAALLGITLETLAQRHSVGETWLKRVDGEIKRKNKQGNVGLYDYLLEEKLPLRLAPLTPVLMAPDTSRERIKQLQSSIAERIGLEARLVDYHFYSLKQDWPSFITMQGKGTFQM